MNLEVGKKYWTIEPFLDSGQTARAPWLATWVRSVEYREEFFRLRNDECGTTCRWDKDEPCHARVYATELEAKKAYVSAKLQEAHDLMERAKQIIGAMKEYVKANEDLKRTFRAQDGGDLQ